MTEVSRRTFLGRAGLAAGGIAAGGAGLGLLTACTDSDETQNGAPPETPLDPQDWDSVRAQFPLSRDLLQFSAFVLASPPRPVAEAIQAHRTGLDADTSGYLGNEADLDAGVLDEAAAYFETDRGFIALTDSTTMGLGLVYGGLRITPGQEVLTTEHDFYATHEALRLRTERDGIGVRRVSLYDDPSTASVDEIVTRLGAAITPITRAVALTWVHSGTGVKLPIAEISAEIASRATSLGMQRPLLCVDGVHGFGVENATPGELGCDFLMSGSHKWLFGPRGTGLVWGTPEAWTQVSTSIPSFAPGAFGAHIQDIAPTDVPPGEAATPGGYKAFEHRWAVAEAFAFHQNIGQDRIAARTHEQATQLKEGLGEGSGVRVVTPLDSELSAGIVCLEVDTGDIFELPAMLREEFGLVASITPYRTPYLRLGPSIVTSPTEVEKAIEIVATLG